MLKKYKAVVFDFDDTLVESRIHKWKHHQYVAKKYYNLEITDGMMLQHWGKPFPKMVTDLYKNVDETPKIIERLWSTNELFHKIEIPEAIALIRKLVQEDVVVGILSSTVSEQINRDLKRLNFPTEKISFIQGAEETEVHKPDGKVFEPMFKKLERLGISKSEVVYVGDSLDDLNAATSAGIDFIGITTGLYTEKDLADNGARVVVKNIGELL